MKAEREYNKVFSEPCEFWTSEDGSLLSLVILPAKNTSAVLRTHHVFRKEKFDKRRMKHRFAYKEWVGSEHFDGGSGQKRGKVWRLQDEPTPFPVIEYELKIPR